MTNTPAEETLTERGLRLALSLQGVLGLAVALEAEVRQTASEIQDVVSGVGMEETLVAESSLASESEGESTEEEQGEFQDAQGDSFFD